MINLIPTKEKKDMIRGFYFRLGTMFFLMLGVVMLVATIALLPSYFLSIAKVNSVSEKLNLEESAATQSINQNTAAEISVLDRKLTILERAEKNKFLVSERVIREVLARKLDDIKITELSYDASKAGEMSIRIRGTAPSRERLLQFRMALEQDPMFKNVDLPISNFVKGSNIQFTITLMPS